jgi:hypothetical protein
VWLVVDLISVYAAAIMLGSFGAACWFCLTVTVQIAGRYWIGRNSDPGPYAAAVLPRLVQGLTIFAWWCSQMTLRQSGSSLQLQVSRPSHSLMGWW